MVVLIDLPNTNIGNNTSEKSYYYINVISLWNHPHVNAYPNPIIPNIEYAKSYEQVDKGESIVIPNSSSFTPTSLNSPINPSQNTFEERADINPLLPFAGM